MSENAQGILDTILDRLNNLASSETVIGEPVSVGDITILPVIKMSVGFGAGSGQGNSNAKTSDQSGGGGGGGASVKPVGFLVYDGKDVKFIGVEGKSKVEGLFDMVPDLLNKFGLGKKKGKADSDKQTEKDSE